MPNFKVTFGAIKDGKDTVFVVSGNTIQGARNFVQNIVNENEKIPESRRILGPLISIEHTLRRRDDDLYFFLLGRKMTQAECSNT